IPLESGLLGGPDRVEALTLELVRAQLVHQPDSAALLTEVEEHPAALLRDPSQCGVQLIPAVAPSGTEYVAGQALGVDPHEHRIAGRDVAHGERDVLGLGIADPRAIAVDRELPILGRQLR